MNDLLLDTCAVIWMGTGELIEESVLSQIEETYRKGYKIHISPISAWELGLLVSKERVRLDRPVLNWFETFAIQSGISIAALSLRILIDSSYLPGVPPNDPCDRIIISTARTLNFSIVTRDSSILDYSKKGHVHAFRC